MSAGHYRTVAIDAPSKPHILSPSQTTAVFCDRQTGSYTKNARVRFVKAVSAKESRQRAQAYWRLSLFWTSESVTHRMGLGVYIGISVTFHEKSYGKPDDFV